MVGQDYRGLPVFWAGVTSLYTFRLCMNSEQLTRNSLSCVRVRHPSVQEPPSLRQPLPPLP